MGMGIAFTFLVLVVVVVPVLGLIWFALDEVLTHGGRPRPTR